MKRQDIERLRAIEVEISSLRRQIQQLEDERCFISSVVVDGMPRAKATKDGMNKTIAYLERTRKLQKRLADKLRERMEDEEQAYAMLDAIEDAELRQIISLRCLEAKTWKEVGEELGMDRRTASRKWEAFWKDAHNARSMCDKVISV